ncbi:Uncharacterized protein YjbI, contains pentapeptide repeats [Psychrobacillus sp. OK028]|uniref:pentapeptide repeat-containing protein n=1 Tax=Psychrobacillus sp. OK028 TaxID=1884359 RepID=UPI0008865331|nr:pentapeptide repeat-containing protein [Psychrobacillus sp. OK028]SDN43256.1 Uncharacterized protein YjbI, contains pentapeptide repeats [Psychrobacillus sp. OK028]
MKITAPKIAKSLQELDVQKALLEDYYVSDGLVTRLELEEEQEGKIIFDQIHFQDISMDGVRFQQVEFVDCIFEKCDLSNVDFGNAVFHRVEIRSSKLVGANISESRMTEVRAVDSIANYVTMSFSKLKKVAFIKTTFNRADFIEATLEKVSFEDCELNDANFTDTALAGIDLSSNTYEQLTVSLDKMKDCTVSSEQAIGFAKSLGLTIKE